MLITAAFATVRNGSSLTYSKGIHGITLIRTTEYCAVIKIVLLKNCNDMRKHLGY